MANLVVIGGQWGDEGKGKVVDLLSPAFSYAARFNGGNNAGHTVRFADLHFALHLVPSGITNASCKCVMGPGMVIDPVALRTEVDGLEDRGVAVRSRLTVSSRAHLILPAHRALDAAREGSKGDARIGTTGRGIGPAYETRAMRIGVRFGLTRNPRRFREAVAALNTEVDRLLTLYPDAPAPTTEQVEEAIDAALSLSPLVGDTSRLLQDAIDADRHILFEGAQGTFLDVDHGTYPFVTSSGCLAGYAAPSSGLPARVVDGVLAVLKAYTTRVGGGPFPTELTDATGEHLRSRGNEIGTTTGRSRRTGWFDGVAARDAVRWNGVDGIALTKLDVLDELATIKVATAYRLDGETLDHVPDDDLEVAELVPVYEELPGWQEETSGITAFDKLPARAQEFVARIEALLGVPAVMISTGPRREETILRREPPFSRWFPSE